MDLFDSAVRSQRASSSPLASRMRPNTLDEVVGQQHIIGKGKLLYRCIKADKLSSIILYGPPGTGKTTLARVIAHTTSADFKQVNATTSGKKDMEEVIKVAKYNFGAFQKKTILFIDEIHRFNKAQQDYLLPYVEDGTVILIGATTENPYFEVNGALLSRSTLFELKPLSTTDLLTLAKRAFSTEKGLAKEHALIDDDAAIFLAETADGDARTLYNALELAAETTERDKDGIIHITLDTARECIQKRVIRYDKEGDHHYDTISAFIESMKHTAPNATLYYLARMLVAGEDPKYIARRICVCASEDIGLADSNALAVAVNAFLAVERIGMPECREILAHAALYVCMAPKSDTCQGINTAMADVQKTGNVAIPAFLQDASYTGADKLGRGKGLRDIHKYPNHYVQQPCLPEKLAGRIYFHPTEQGDEKRLMDDFRKLTGQKETTASEKEI
ncbi:MAG: replication-associated recombination protein A [Prevotella sp.]|jgi:putative ATPase|nr:replication-associated recombination protein A [Prevotella sp.]